MQDVSVLETRTDVLLNLSVSFQRCQTVCWSTSSSSLMPLLLPSSLTPTPGPPSYHTGPSPHTLLHLHQVSTHTNNNNNNDDYDDDGEGLSLSLS